MVKSCRSKAELAEIAGTSVSARGSDLRVHFKNTYETVTAVKGMNLLKAKEYLHQVLDKKRCIPYFRYKGGVGRTGQAREFGTTQGRWPQKSVRHVLDLFQNLEANANVKGLRIEDLYIWHAAVHRAAKGRRRTYRAHGRINPWMSHPCHIELICKPKEVAVPKPKADGEHEQTSLNRRQNHTRQMPLDA
eukprot:Protomagalhaensia_wolfi_Nauph_80__411@NODE_1227_length_1647_cov_290_631841_g944_i0_p2_GENE_NODE_1227_length_1647_cov_290_631841_g944_i0NODE_1227_length_1647_cov_290_631841_g944_i0_p2_ORF_typecomplete_len190_score27_14Ribosomal_L22/PF00237_19/2_8e32_NODE_1227_length_1647_cov_290_631841_g944_i09831552